eukprot:g3650.t1
MDADLGEINEEVNLFFAKANEEDRRYFEFQNLIGKARKKIKMLKEKRKDKGGINAMKTKGYELYKQIRIYENKLNKLSIRASEGTQENEKLKKQIDNLRAKIISYKKIYADLQHEHARVQKKIAEQLEMANEYHEEKKRIEEELLQLGVKVQEEKIKYQEELSRLINIVEEENEKRKEIENMHTVDIHNVKRGSMSYTEELSMKDQILNAQSAIQEKKVQIVNAEGRIKSHKEAFMKLKAIAKLDHLTGLRLVQEIVNLFVSREDYNFTLFDRIQRLNRECDIETENMRKIEMDMKKYAIEQKEHDTKREKTRKELERRLQWYDDQRDSYAEKIKRSRATIASLCDTIHHVFETVGCRKRIAEMVAEVKKADLELMEKEKKEEQAHAKRRRSTVRPSSRPGTSESTRGDAVKQSTKLLESLDREGITAENIMQCMGIVEQTASELKATYRKVQILQHQREMKNAGGIQISSSYSSHNKNSMTNIIPPPGPPMPRNRIQMVIEVPEINEKKRNANENEEGDEEDDSGSDSDDDNMIEPIFSDQLAETFSKKNALLDVSTRGNAYHHKGGSASPGRGGVERRTSSLQR